MDEQKSESFFDPNEEWVDPRSLVEPLRKRLWAVGLIITVSLMLSILYNLCATPMYEAKSSVVLRQNVNENVLREKEISIEQPLEPNSELKTKIKIAQSPTMLRKVVERLITQGSFKKPLQEIHFDRMNPEEQSGVIGTYVSRIQNQLIIENPEETAMIEISYTDSDPYLARDVVNLLAEIVVEDHRDEELLLRKDSLSYLNQQMDDARKRVGEAESKLYEYRRQHNIFEADWDKELVAKRSSGLLEKLTEVQGTRRLLEAQSGQLDSLLQRQDGLKYASLMPNNKILMDLKQQLVTAEIHYRKLLISYKDKHPEVGKARQEIEILKQKFEQELQVTLIQLQSQLRVTQAQEQFLQDTLAASEHSAVMSTKKDIEYVVMDREARSAREIYQTLLAAVKEVTINTNSAGNNVIYVQDKAMTPRNPVTPHQSSNLYLGLLIGVMLGGVFAYGREYLDRQMIRNPDDVQAVVNLPVLCTVPLDSIKPPQTLPAGAEPERRLLVAQRPKSLFSESIIALRSQLNIKLPADSPKVILVTSCVPQEGKSLIASNLALSLAINGQKTLLIDTDLHHPVVHNIFGREKSEAGLYDLVVDALSPLWSALNLETMSLGDVQHLIQLKQWSGTININWDHLPSPLKVSFREGRPAGSNFRAWKKESTRPDGFPLPTDLSFSLDASEILSQDGRPDSGLQAINFLHQYPSVCRSEYFADLVQQRFVQPTDHKNLSIITAGADPKSPHEILGSEQMKMLLQLLRERYDRIIIDAPPAWPLSDVSVLSPMMDWVLWVCRAGVIPRKVFMHTLQQIRKVQPNIIGVVMNAVDMHRDRNYYYGYPYSDYHQRYYQHDDDSQDARVEMDMIAPAPAASHQMPA